MKKYRDQHGLFLVYGNHLVDAAKKHDALVECLTSNPLVEGIQLTKELMDGLQQAETYFDVIGVCKKTNPMISSNRILMLDDIQDPDNLGALMRSASAFGFMHIILSHQSADVYNEKAIRASKGALFDLYIERKPLVEAILSLKESNYTIIYTDAHGSESYEPKGPLVLILGNEGHGVSEDVKHIADASITIPTQNVESLNVSVAGAILMHMWRLS